MSLPAFGVRNPIFVNLLMWATILGGLFYWNNLVREFFPNSEPEQVIVSVAYPGATPDEVEEAVTIPLEREIENLEGLEELSAEVLEGVTALRLTLEPETDRARFLDELRAEVDRVEPDLPEGALDPVITELRPFFPVISVVVYGDVSETRLREAALDVRDDLVALPEISEVTVSGIRDREILIEAAPERLEEHGLTFGDVGRAVAAVNLDLPGGQLEGERGNIRIRTVGEEERARAIEDLIVRGGAAGDVVRLSQVADVREGFEDKIEKGRWEGGLPAVTVAVLKTPEQDAIDIATRVKQYVADHPTLLDGALRLDTTSDLSKFIEQRLDLMLRNARSGLLLVCLCLFVFLTLRVAFWVAVGLPVAFLGTFVLMHLMGASINLISLFGLIIVLGLIVDDAIVIGENVFTKIREGMPPAQAAVEGTNEVALPVLAAVLTTIIAFLPLAYIEGRIGTFLGVLPIVVIAALAVSLVEAYIILPGHLGHVKADDPDAPRSAFRRRWDAFQEWKNGALERTLSGALERLLRFTLHWRYAALAGALAVLMGTFGLVAGGVVPFQLLQDTGAETIQIQLEMAAGTPEERTAEVVGKLEDLVAADVEVESVFAVIGTSFTERGRESAADPATVGQLTVQLTPADERERVGERQSAELVNAWRRASADYPGVRKLTIEERAGGPGGADLELRVQGEDLATLERAMDHVREAVGSYDGVTEIEDDLRTGKLEARVRLLDSARALGLTTRDVAVELRNAFFGFEAQDLQEEDGEVTVRVVLPEAARSSLGDLGRLRIATAAGSRVPLEEVVELDFDRGSASISRVDGRRAVTLQAEVDETRANVQQVTESLTADFADIGERFPGVSVSFEGRKKETTESLGSLAIGFPVAMLAIYGLLAVLFRSYYQPFVVMIAIPFAIVGAVLGHLVMGFPLTLLSMIGIVALAGIVVNDSLILVDFVNRRRRDGMPLVEAIVDGAKSRLRAILLTSITTVAGIAPLMFETSFQAQFLIPMAISIAFGLAFATFLTLVLLPTVYLVVEDLKGCLRWLWTGHFTRGL